MGAGARDCDQGCAGVRQADADASQAPTDGRTAGRRRALRVRRAARGLGRARAHGAAERAHPRPAE
eukprot:5788581-Pleurochrysis_carterae.AAC.1